MDLPLAVGRALMRLDDSGDASHASRSELLDQVHVLSRRCAWDRAVSLLDRRDYSAREVRDRLARDGYDARVCEETVARALSCGLVDDARYADALIRSKLAAGWGRMRIERELSRRGIDVAGMRGWPRDYLDPDDEFERALAVARTRRIAARNGYEKLVRFLANRGYALSLATKVARQVLEEASG